MKWTDQFDITNWLLHVVIKAGVRDVVISPGSRNAPLIISLKKNFPEVRLHSVVDERSAGFKAVGIADITRKPVALVCTSGTAAANYLPAVCEAFFRSVPLVVITADRPEHLITARDGQTIFQHHLYGRHVEEFWALSPSTDLSQTTDHLIDMYSKISHIQRPVHINIHYDEPLYVHKPFSGLPFTLPAPRAQTIWRALPEINPSKKVMIAVGQCPPGFIPEDLQASLADNGFLLVSGGLSNLDPRFSITQFNQLNTQALPEPELVISLGGEITHKPLKNYLRSLEGLKHWHIEQIDYAPDTFAKSVQLFHIHAVEALRNWVQNGQKANRNFAQQWQKMNADIESSCENHLDEECKNFYLPVAKAAKDQQAMIVLGNSTIVRQYLKLPGKYHQYLYGNRGTAGIDGSLSTAVGMALATDQKVWCLIGDLSFFYDLNALWQNLIPENLTVFVYNNQRGKIFEMIPGPEKFPEIYPYQATPHAFSCRHIALHFSMNYHLWDVKNSIDFSLHLGKSIVEINL